MKKETAPRLVRADIHVLALDETRDWHIEPADAPYVAAILSLKFYDASEVTYCCEMTPSYCLHFLEYQLRWTPAGEALAENDPDAAESIRDHYELAQTEEDVAYWHCHRIEDLLPRLIAQGDYRYHHYGDPLAGSSDAQYQDWAQEQDPMESVREDLQANSVL
jgi:hypothetical protein